MNQLPNNLNTERRKFLKILLVGVGSFFLGKFLSPIAGFLGIFKSREVLIKTPEPQSELQQKTDLKNWRVIEKNNQVTFIDKKTNEEVLILD